MQTFLPYPDFEQSARCLDIKRLGKQRVEGLQIMQTLLGLNSGWANHPAVRMWQGCLGSLANYTIQCCDAWTDRGYKDTVRFQVICLVTPSDKYKLPWWFGHGRFHASHRSNLLRKDPEFYSQYGWSEPPDLPYMWPGLKEKSWV